MLIETGTNRITSLLVLLIISYLHPIHIIRPDSVQLTKDSPI